MKPSTISLPSADHDTATLLAFRQQLKMQLLTSSFHWYMSDIICCSTIYVSFLWVMPAWS